MLVGTGIDEIVVRQALADLLQRHGMQAQGQWVTVRTAQRRGFVSRDYVVVITYAAANDALSSELKRITGENQAGSAKLGIWILNEWQARELCEKHLTTHHHTDIRHRSTDLSQDELIDILLIEDDYFDRTLTIRGLQSYGMFNPMHACERAEDGLRLLERNKAIGLVLLDLSLPGMSGLEFLSNVRSNPETADIPVVVLTGSSSELDAERCRRLRADGYLVKPIVFARVVELVKTLGLRWALLPAKATA